MARVDALLSWNMKCGPLAKADASAVQRRLDLLSSMVGEHSATLVALQEAPPIGEIRSALGVNFGVVRTAHGVATAFDIHHWSCDVEEVSDSHVVALGLLATGAGTSMWMLNVHGIAMNVDEEDRRDFIRTRVRSRLGDLRQRDGNRLEIVVGDLNLAPFDIAVMRATGLKASRSLPWVRDRATGLDRALFNPTWTLLGRHEGASGTFYRAHIAFDGPWRAFDQVMVSSELASGLTFDAIEKVGSIELRKRGPVGAPNVETGSDHLPVVARMTIP